MTTNTASPVPAPVPTPAILTPSDVVRLRTATDMRPALALQHNAQLAAAALITPSAPKKRGRPAKAPASPKRRGPATAFADGTGSLTMTSPATTGTPSPTITPEPGTSI